MARKARRRKSRPDYIKRTFVVGGVLIALVMGYYVLRHYRIMFYDHITPGSNYPVRGIDVSVHNGNIDFNKVAAAGNKFVFVKSSEGSSHKDSKFKRNCRKAAQAGLNVGAYHFFRKDRDGVNQARNMLAAVRGVKLDLPLVIDVEDSDNNNSVSDRVVRDRLVAMVREIKKSGHKVMLYTNGNGMEKYYKPCFKNEYLWLCIFKNPDDVKNRGHIFQQYEWKGECPGVDGDVDLDVFMGSTKEWEAWIDEINR